MYTGVAGDCVVLADGEGVEVGLSERGRIVTVSGVLGMPIGDSVVSTSVSIAEH